MVQLFTVCKAVCRSIFIAQHFLEIATHTIMEKTYFLSLGPQNLGRMVRGDLRGKLQNRNENFEQPSGQEQRDVQSYRGQRGK